MYFFLLNFFLYIKTDITTFIRLLEQPNYTTVVKTLNAGINLDDDDLVEGVFLKPQQQQQQKQQPSTSSSSTSSAISSTKMSKQQSSNENDKDVYRVKEKAAAETTPDINEKVKIKNKEYKNYVDLQNQKHSQVSSASASTLRAEDDVLITKDSSTFAEEKLQKQQDKNLNIGYCHLTKALERDFNKTVLLWPCPQMKVSTLLNMKKIIYKKYIK